jgi:anti-anti-sigma regulatory factor
MTVDTAAPAGLRLVALRDRLARLAGDETATAQAGAGDDALDQIERDLDRLAGLIEHQRVERAEAERRGDELLGVMMTMAARDYAQRAPVGDGNTLFDALAAGLNMLADELSAAQLEREQLQEQIIQTQAAVIQELSTPLIPINDHILVMPLIGSIDSTRAHQMIDRLLEGVAASHPHTVILDITGVVVVDTQVANMLVRSSQAVQLLGTRMLLTGIRPEVAQTLVNLGADLRGLVTWSTLQMGITYAMQHTGGSSAWRR